MTKLLIASFKGASGAEYDFNVYSFDTSFTEIEAVYIVTNRQKTLDSYFHDLIYIGQTDNLKERFENHHKANCFEENKANTICVHQEATEKIRLLIEEDLIKGNHTPCND